MTDNIIDFTIDVPQKTDAKECKEEVKERAIDVIKEVLIGLEEGNIDPDDFILLTTHNDKLDSLIETNSYDIFHSNMTVREVLGMIEITKNHFLNIIQR